MTLAGCVLCEHMSTGRKDRLSPSLVSSLHVLAKTTCTSRLGAACATPRSTGGKWRYLMSTTACHSDASHCPTPDDGVSGVSSRATYRFLIQSPETPLHFHGTFAGHYSINTDHYV